MGILWVLSFWLGWTGVVVAARHIITPGHKKLKNMVWKLFLPSNTKLDHFNLVI